MKHNRGYNSNREKILENIGTIFLLILVVFTMVWIAITIFEIIPPANVKLEDYDKVVDSYELYAIELGTQQNAAGAMVLGTGIYCMTNSDYYIIDREYKDGDRIEKISIAEGYTVQDSSQTPHVEVIVQTQRYYDEKQGIYVEYNYANYSPIKYKIVVPDGSVPVSYDINIDNISSINEGGS